MYGELSKKKLLSRLFSNAGLYSIAIVINRVGAILILPIYWERLTPADFGLIGLSQLVVLFLSPLLSLGFYDGVQRFYYIWGVAERSRYLAALWLTSLICSIFICLSLGIFGAPLFSYALSQVDFNPYIKLAIGITFCNSLSLFPLTLLRVREQLLRFSVITIGSFLTQISVVLWLLFFTDLQAAKGYMWGIFISSALWSIYYIVYMAKEIQLPFTRRHLVEPLLYSAPTVPAAIMDSVGSVFDRYFLDKYAALSIIGVYNLGNQFGSAVNSANQVLKSAWVPFIFRVINERDDARVVLGRVSVYYVAVMAIATLSLSLLSQELIIMIGNPKFFEVADFIPWFALIYYIQSMGTALGRGLDLAKKTIYSPLPPFLGIATNWVSMWILVPIYGVWGAVASFLITTVIRIFSQIILSVWAYPRPLMLISLVKINLIAFLAYIIGVQLYFNNILIDILIKCVLIIGVSTVLIFWALDWRSALEVFRDWRKYNQNKSDKTRGSDL